jgi:hypothetical protein
VLTCKEAPFTEGVKETLMEDRQDSKTKRARKRARNLVAKQNKYSGFAHKTDKNFRRKEKYPEDFES